MYNKIIKLLEENKYIITDDVKFYTERLAECLNSKDKSDISFILNWLNKRRKEYAVNTKEIGVKNLNNWDINPQTGNISHESGKFFSIIGVEVSGAEGREVTSWTQPMIKQNECGILGILCKKINGIMHYLLYAKYEPGNMYKLQLSPTLQATESNLKRAHGGKKPLFAEYFEGGGRGKVLCSVVSVEDGGRFYLKTNRNMIVEVDENEKLDIPDDFIWVNLPQFKKLLKKNAIINNLVRSVMGSWQ